ncbi:uncharacterized protein [Amphiura filiformis]|uniref:uncharacterized protein n=1 Tax=Amphiura filiformis TaxID=82378 RepID=UPI003B21DE1A
MFFTLVRRLVARISLTLSLMHAIQTRVAQQRRLVTLHRITIISVGVPDGSQICDGSAYSCNTNPCRNGGDCSWKKKNKHTDFLCACRENWTGATCEQASNLLVTNPPARPDPGLTENKPITKGKPDIQKTQTTPRPTTRITGTPKSKSKEEEWSLYGLSKVDLIGIVLPMVVGIPGAILAFAKICITMRNKRAAQDNAKKEKPTQGPS